VTAYISKITCMSYRGVQSKKLKIIKSIQTYFNNLKMPTHPRPSLHCQQIQLLNFKCKDSTIQKVEKFQPLSLNKLSIFVARRAEPGLKPTLFILKVEQVSRTSPRVGRAIKNQFVNNWSSENKGQLTKAQKSD